MEHCLEHHYSGPRKGTHQLLLPRHLTYEEKDADLALSFRVVGTAASPGGNSCIDEVKQRQ